MPRPLSVAASPHSGGEALITGAVIDAAPQLRVIGRTGVGVDSIDVARATGRTRTLSNRRGAAASETTAATPQPRVEQVSHGVAEHVETEDGDSQAQTGPERQPRRYLHILASLPAEQTPPIRSPGRQTKSEEAQRSQSEDYAAYAHAEHYDHDRQDIRHHVSHECAQSRGANGVGRMKIHILFDADHGASDYSTAANAS